jgi:signal transduction histidine kinase
MFESIPRHIIQYLLEKLPPYAGLMAMHVDAEGGLLGWYGPWSHYFDSSAQRGKRVSDFLPFLEGVFPLPEHSLEMPRLQHSDDQWINLYIFKDIDQRYWIFLSDCSRETAQLQSLLQKVNENKLKEETSHQAVLRKNPFGQVQLFQVATFERLSDHLYAMCGTAPDWLCNLKPNIINRGVVNLTEQFPFLEVFADEMRNELAETDRKFYNSGIWIESDEKGKEYFLRAFLTYADDKAYLLIRMLNDDLLGEQDTIQKAREQQLAYEHMAKAKKELKELLDYKDKFVSIITHDLRSPIASVLGATEMLLNDTSFTSHLDSFNYEMLVSMRDEMNRMLDYNAKLYHWSNLELGNFELIYEQIKVSELMAIVEKTFQNQFIEKGIQFIASFHDNDLLEVDITLFLQALNNLVGNALKFTPEGGQIQLIYQHDDAGRRLTVKDTGMGMKEEKASHLFEQTSHESALGTKGEKGSGLGLGIVKRIIEAHHFKISARSTPGVGTEITIKL